MRRAPPVRRGRIKRPFTIHYHAHDSDVPTSQGHAATDKGAIRAAVVRIFLEEHAEAIVYDRRTGAVAYTIRVVGGALRVHYGTATGRR
jgi:hypothetical protein